MRQLKGLMHIHDHVSPALGFSEANDFFGPRAARELPPRPPGVPPRRVCASAYLLGDAGLRAGICFVLAFPARFPVVKSVEASLRGVRAVPVGSGCQSWGRSTPRAGREVSRDVWGARLCTGARGRERWRAKQCSPEKTSHIGLTIIRFCLKTKGAAWLAQRVCGLALSLTSFGHFLPGEPAAGQPVGARRNLGCSAGVQGGKPPSSSLPLTSNTRTGFNHVEHGGAGGVASRFLNKDNNESR